MKKQSFLFVAASVITLASCQPNANENGYTDAQVDSMVGARVEEIRMEMMAHNDSLIDMMAQHRADSIIAAMKGGNSVTTHTSTTRTTTVTPGGTKTTTPPPTSETKWNQNNTSNQPTSKTKWDQNDKTDEKKAEPTSKTKWGK